MIPYPHSWPNQPSEEQKQGLSMTTTPYKNFLSSSTDSVCSSIRGPTAHDINLSYRYASPVGSLNELYKSVFSISSVDWISDQVTSRLAGVHPEGKNIIVPDETILSVLDSFWNNGLYMDVDLVRQQTVMFIVESVKNDMEMEVKNNSYNIWNTIAFTPDKGLVQTNDIKLNERRYSPSWVWNY